MFESFGTFGNLPNLDRKWYKVQRKHFAFGFCQDSFQCLNTAHLEKTICMEIRKLGYFLIGTFSPIWFGFWSFLLGGVAYSDMSSVLVDSTEALGGGNQAFARSTLDKIRPQGGVVILVTQNLHF